MLSYLQKKLIVEVLLRENRRIFSKHKGKLLEKTIADLTQAMRNEAVNDNTSYDKSLDWASRDKREKF